MRLKTFDPFCWAFRRQVRLKLGLKISALDEKHTVKIANQDVPSVNVREIKSSVEMPLGGTVVFGAQCSDVVNKQVANGKKQNSLEDNLTLVLIQCEIAPTMADVKWPWEKPVDAPAAEGAKPGESSRR